MSNINIKITNLKNRIRQVCSEDTTHPSCKEEWSKANPMLGHCAVASAIFYNKFGGEIIRGIIAESGISHYWNRLDGVEYDLTKEQFTNHVTLVEAKVVSIDRIMGNGNTKERYDLLMQKLLELPEYAND